MSYNNLKIVVLECPYDIWDISPTQEVFGKMVSMKLAGYRARHPYGVMPVDAYDYIGIHQLVCQETPSGLRVLMGYKMVANDRCRIHHMPFPMASVFAAGGADEHVAAVRAIVTRCEREKISLAYPASWTMEPSMREDPELQQQLREIFEAMYVLCPESYGFTEIVVGGVPRLGTDALFTRMGHERVGAAGEPLSAVSVPHLQGDRVVLMHLKQFSPAALAKAEKWRSLWEDRLVIGPRSAAVAELNLPLKKAA